MGGKLKEIPKLIKYIPQFSGRFIEPFFGGGALFFHLEPKKAIINDINPKLISFYLDVKENFESLKTELSEIGKLYGINRMKFEGFKSKISDFHKQNSWFAFNYFVSLCWRSKVKDYL